MILERTYGDNLGKSETFQNSYFLLRCEQLKVKLQRGITLANIPLIFLQISANLGILILCIWALVLKIVKVKTNSVMPQSRQGCILRQKTFVYFVDINFVRMLYVFMIC